MGLLWAGLLLSRTLPRSGASETLEWTWARWTVLARARARARTVAWLSVGVPGAERRLLSPALLLLSEVAMLRADMAVRERLAWRAHPCKVKPTALDRRPFTHWKSCPCLSRRSKGAITVD